MKLNTEGIIEYSQRILEEHYKTIFNNGEFIVCDHKDTLQSPAMDKEKYSVITTIKIIKDEK